MENAWRQIQNNHIKCAHLFQNPAKSVRDFLKIIGYAFLVVILLVGLWVGEAKAQSFIEMTPKQITITGIIGTSSFQQPFTLHAVNENITELTFSSSNLLEISGGKSWISGANIQVTPAVTKIKKGQSQDFIVTVQNIPESGQYQGVIAISYIEQEVEAQDTLPISVQASNFSASPPEIILKFEKNVVFTGGSVIPWTLAMNEYSGRAPQKMITTLTENTSVSLEPLVNNEDKSEVIRPEQLLPDQPVISETRLYGQGLTINANFTNPQVTAGKYSGTLLVRSKEMGLLAAVPVEVQVRYPSWIAWILIVAGVGASALITWWNTTGKKKNEIRDKELEERKKLDKAEITKTCSRQIQDKLDDVDGLLDREDFDGAQKIIDEARDIREKCVTSKRELDKKSSEVADLINDLENKVVRPLEQRVKDKPVNTYVMNIETDLKIINENIKKEKYTSVDDDLKNKFEEQKSKLGSISDMLNLLTKLEHNKNYNSILKKVESISSEQDVIAVKEEIKTTDLALHGDSGNQTLLAIESKVKEGAVEAEIPGIDDKLKASLIKKFGYDSDLVNKAKFRKIDDNTTKVIMKIDNNRTDEFIAKMENGELNIHKETKSNIWNSIFKWWTPVRTEEAVNFLLSVLALVVLAVIGYSQLYANNPFFGARNLLEEYLTLFLWGFGIQTGTATAANVLKTFRPS